MNHDKTAFELLIELIQLQMQKQVLLGGWPTMSIAEIDQRTSEIKDRLTGDGR